MTVKKKRFEVPHTYVLLLVMVLICALLALVVPAGAYETAKDVATGRTIKVPGTFQYLEGSSAMNFFDVMKEFVFGMESSSDIIFFIFILGGAFTIVQDTGAMAGGIHALVRRYGKRQDLILILFIFIFSIFGGTIGMAEEVIVFVPLVVMLCRQFKLDRMVALAVCMIGARVGFTTGLINPFTVGVAQGLSGLPMYSGLAYRLIWYALILVVTCWYILRYAHKIQKDPTSSIMYGVDVEEDADSGEEVELTGRRIAVLVLFFATMAFMVYGVFRYGWYMEEIATIFLIMGILAGIIGGLGANGTAKSFVRGAKDMTYAALMVGIAKAILLVLQDGGIIDTIIYLCAGALEHLPKMIAVWGMYIFQLVLNFFIPSGSGQAAATMPIMAPLADMLGITRQTAVLCFHYGDGFTNLVVPTLGSLMGAVAVSKVPFDRYLKWVAPLCAVWCLIGLVSVTGAVLINYGPF
ncbi:MAG: YfcC family protein [Erysipelotrichaceae bacterium]|nr:YfcC family protein [Erysipelotrichaceae bacterium]